MAAYRMKFAHLDDENLEKVQHLEEQLGSIILVLEPQYSVATLSDEQLEQVKDLEQAMGVVLVAYQA